MTEPLRKVDLNLLLVFDTLWVERSVSVAARKIGLSQSAVSLALNRLRSLLDDNLFVWNGRTMQPTGRCEEISPRIHAIINDVRETILGNSFDPSKATREFTIASADYIHWALGGKIVQSIQRSAPNFTLYLTDAKPEMTEGHSALQHELFILPAGVFNTVGMSHQYLFTDRYVGIAAESNRLVREGMSRDDFLKMSQASFSTHAKYLRSHETMHLSEMDIYYKFSALTPHYLVLPFLAAESSSVVIMQERLARYFATFLPLRLFLPPIPYPDLAITLYWHPTFDKDAAHQWLRSTVKDVGDELGALPPRENRNPEVLQFID
ncbi:LysR family transcriptional regulator [Sphingomonas sp. Root710]|uniref:LysR family transcriptional regulator n=1 Tax=Sphingomonas sp. Root710 TaxID=1736594 RepID=UPI000AC8D861|nr:LysR family transcriptional regulator [Sphingomonas sp. Root710]